MGTIIFASVGAVFALGIIGFLVATTLRRVVPTNEVHIVQTKKQTISYGKDTQNGNVYYEWPSSWPILGVTKTVLPVSNFDISLDGYEAYDEGRLPFKVDIMSFFRVKNPNTAAQRVASFVELQDQLRAIVQGAARSILASNNIEVIMQGRSQFGEYFTTEVSGQLDQWGVETVKNIELMDIRDSQSSEVIANIMAKKKSQIEAESRTAVANNHRDARLAEIDAQKTTDLSEQEARQAVGEREIGVNLKLDSDKEVATQKVNEQRKITTETAMKVKQVSDVESANIAREVRVVKAEEDRQARVIEAEAQRDQTRLIADGQLEATRREAEGIQAKGTATADAERAIQLAPVQAQIELAREIGENEGYQRYLIQIRSIEADQLVGMEQATALQRADIKVIVTADNGTKGVSSVGDLVTATGGAKFGAMIEAARQTPAVDQLLNKVLPSEKNEQHLPGSRANGSAV